MGNGIPFQEIAGFFGITLSAKVLSFLTIAQWVVGFLFLVSGYAIAWYQRWQRRKLQEEKRKSELEGHDLDWVVIGAGAVTLDDTTVEQGRTHHIRTFAEKPVKSEFGDLFAEILREAAEATIRTPGTQIMHIVNEKLRDRIFARGFNKLNEFKDSEVVGLLTEGPGKHNFVCCFTCSDYDSRKIRMSMRSLKELERYKLGSKLHTAATGGFIGRLVNFAKSFHDHDARLTAEIAEKWFANPTATNEYCWLQELSGRV